MMTILAGIFANLRKYRKEQGRLELHFIKEYISDGRLIRVGQGQTAQYMQLIREPETEEYDVVVDESPTSPNQKDQTWIILSQMLPLLTKLPTPPQFWMKIVEYSPLPSTLSDDLVKIIQDAMQDQSTKPMPYRPTVNVAGILEHGNLTPEERRQLMVKIGIVDPALQPPGQRPPQGGMGQPQGGMQMQPQPQMRPQ